MDQYVFFYPLARFLRVELRADCVVGASIFSDHADTNKVNRLTIFDKLSVVEISHTFTPSPLTPNNILCDDGCQEVIMDNLISLEDADAIAQHARFVSEVQRQVNHANELIEALQSDERAEVEVSFSTAFKQGHY